MTVFLSLCFFGAKVCGYLTNADRNDNQIKPRLYIYSVAGDAFLDWVSDKNEEIVSLGSGYQEPQPFYYKEANENSGLILSTSDFNLENDDQRAVLDLSKSNEKLITFKYHGYGNQVFYLKAIDAKTFKIHCDESCVSYDDKSKCFVREKCDFSKTSDNQLFEIYDDNTLDLFKTSIPELKQKLRNQANSNRLDELPVNNECICPKNLILAKDGRSKINKPPANCQLKDGNKNSLYSFWDEDSNPTESNLMVKSSHSNKSDIKKDSCTHKPRQSNKNSDFSNNIQIAHELKDIIKEEGVQDNSFYKKGKSKLQTMCQNPSSSIISDPLCDDADIMGKLKQIAELESFALY